MDFKKRHRADKEKSAASNQKTTSRVTRLSKSFGGVENFIHNHDDRYTTFFYYKTLNISDRTWPSKSVSLMMTQRMMIASRRENTCLACTYVRTYITRSSPSSASRSRTLTSTTILAFKKKKKTVVLKFLRIAGVSRDLFRFTAVIEIYTWRNLVPSK